MAQGNIISSLSVELGAEIDKKGLKQTIDEFNKLLSGLGTKKKAGGGKTVGEIEGIIKALKNLENNKTFKEMAKDSSDLVKNLQAAQTEIDSLLVRQRQWNKKNKGSKSIDTGLLNKRERGRQQRLTDTNRIENKIKDRNDRAEKQQQARDDRHAKNMALEKQKQVNREKTIELREKANRQPTPTQQLRRLIKDANQAYADDDAYRQKLQVAKSSQAPLTEILNKRLKEVDDELNAINSKSNKQNKKDFGGNEGWRKKVEGLNETRNKILAEKERVSTEATRLQSDLDANLEIIKEIEAKITELRGKGHSAGLTSKEKEERDRQAEAKRKADRQQRKVEREAEAEEKKLRKAKENYDSDINKMEKQNDSLKKHINSVDKVKKKWGETGDLLKKYSAYLSTAALYGYAKQMANITAEFDMQRRALGSLVNDQAKAIGMFNQLKSMSLDSPFTLMQLTAATKQLSAYDVKAKDLIKTTKMLGDISSATGVDIDRLILAYGQVNTAHYLRGQEVRQFTEAGVPILQALANRFSVTEKRKVTADQVQQRIQEKGVTFEDVQASLEAMTGKGGKFYNFQSVIAETTYGKIQKLNDAIQQGWDRLGRQGQGVFNTILDIAVNVAKNLSGYVKVLGTGLVLWKAIGTVKKANMILTEKEEKLETARLTAIQLQYNYTKMAEKARYVGKDEDAEKYTEMAKEAGEKAKDFATRSAALKSVRLQASKIRKETKAMAVNAKGFNKALILAKGNMRALGAAAKMVGVAFKGILSSLAGLAVITAIGAVIGKIMSVIDEAKQLKADLKEIEAETTGKTAQQIDTFNQMASVVMATADGTKEQEKALQDLSQTFGDILPQEQLEIENLKKLKGHYESLTNQIKEYNIAKKTEEQRNVILSTEDGKEALENISFIEGLTTKEQKDTAKGIMPQIKETLQSEISSGIITSFTEAKQRTKELARQLGGEFEDEFAKHIHLNASIKSLLDDLEKISKEEEKAKQGIYGKGGWNRVKRERQLESNATKFINNSKTGADYEEKRNKILEQRAKWIAQTLTDEQKAVITEDKIKQYLEQQTDLKKEFSELNQKDQTGTIQLQNTLSEIKGIYTNIVGDYDMSLEYNQSILKLMKGQSWELTRQLMLLKGQTVAEQYYSSSSKRDTAKKWLEEQKEQPKTLKNIGGGVTKEAIEKILSINDAEIAATERNKVLYSLNRTDLNENTREYLEYVRDYLEYYVEGFVDKPTKTKGNNGSKGQSAIEKQTKEWTEWIGMIDKARQTYKEFKDYYFDETAMDKTVKAYEQQFSYITDQFKMTTGFQTLSEWIKTNGDFTKGLENIANYIQKELLPKATGSDKKRVEEFLYNTILPKISADNVDMIKRRIDEYIKAMEYQLEKSKGRINIFEEVFKSTGNESIAQGIADAFYGIGNMSKIGSVKQSFVKVIKNITDDVSTDTKGRTFYNNLIHVLRNEDDAFSWQALEEQLNSPDLPNEVKQRLLSIFKEFKQANEDVLKDAINAYKEELSIEEKRLTAYNEMLRKQRELEEQYQGGMFKGKENEYYKLMDNYKRAFRSTNAQLELEAIKSSEIYLNLFNNIEKAGLSSLNVMREQLVKIREEVKDDPTKLKEITNEIKKIDDVLRPKKYSLSDAFSLPSKQELVQKIQALREAESEYSNNSLRIEQSSIKANDLQKRIDAGMATGVDENGKVINYNQQLESERKLQDEKTEENEELAKEIEVYRQAIYEIESLRAKAIEYLQKTIDTYLAFSNSSMDTANSIVSSLQSGLLLYSQGLNSGKENKDLANIISAISETKNFFSSLKSIWDNLLKSWSEISGLFSKSIETSANNLSMDANTTSMDANTIAINNLTTTIQGGNATSAVGDITKNTKKDNGLLGGIRAITPYVSMALATIQVGTAIYSAAVKIHDSRIQDQIDDLNDKIKELDDTMTDLGHLMKRSAGNQYFNQMKQQMQLYLQQAELAQEQADKARQKKKADEDEIEQYEDKVKQLTEQAKQMSEQMFSYLLGSSDVQSYLENIVSVFTQAKQSGESTFKALRKSFGEMITSMVQKLMLTSIIEAKFQTLFSKITEMANRGTVSTADISELTGIGLKATEEANNALSAMYPVIKQINNAFGITTSTAGSLASGIQGMTEETASTMSGYLMANFDRLGEIQKSVYAIQQSIGAKSSGSGMIAGEIMSVYQTNALDNLVKIQANTLISSQKAQQVYDLLIGMRVINNSASGATYALQVTQE